MLNRKDCYLKGEARGKILDAVKRSIAKKAAVR